MRRGVFAPFLWIGLAGLAAGCFSTAREIGKAPTESRDLQLSYTFTLTIPSETGTAEIWIPLPRTDENQKLKHFKVTSPLSYSVQTDPDYGNSLLRFETNGSHSESVEIRLDVNVSRSAQSKQGKNASARENVSPEMLRRFLQPDRLVPTNGRIAEEARRVVKPGMPPLEKARAIYDYVVETMNYDKSGTGWGKGDALWACDVKRGNCTDFHSLFIGMARASGIPARFVMGFPVPENKKEGEITGYHCWAEFYVDGEGWIPVDASEAWKHPKKKDFFFGNLDANRVAFTIGRDIRLDPELEPFNYLIYPQVRIGGRQFSEIRPAVRFADGLN